MSGSSSVKLLGVTIDNKLNFDEHVTKLCKKVSQKIHALARMSNYMSQDKLRILMRKPSLNPNSGIVLLFGCIIVERSIIELIGYMRGLLGWSITDPSLTFDKLLCKDNLFQVHHRNLQILATEMYKAKNNLSPTIIKVFKDRENPYNLCNVNPFQSTNVNTVHNGINTVAFQGPKIWAIVPEEIKKSESLAQFKAKIKT